LLQSPSLVGEGFEVRFKQRTNYFTGALKGRSINAPRYAEGLFTKKRLLFKITFVRDWREAFFNGGYFDYSRSTAAPFTSQPAIAASFFP
jgi:hypothetical protein